MNTQNLTQELQLQELARLLEGVEKPARYVGREPNSIIKPGAVAVRLALCFPDIYEVAESHLGLKILYQQINQHPHFAAERVYAVWPDLEKKLRAQGFPLWSLETWKPLATFDVVGFSLSFELCYPTALAMLDLGQLPLLAANRLEHHPLVIAGGNTTYHPAPMEPFLDACVIGDGEEVILEILATVAQAKTRQNSRQERLKQLATIPGVYVPAVHSHLPGYRTKRRALLQLNLDSFPKQWIVPHVQPVHDRVMVEIQRGCTRGCRFCQSGMVSRPTRQRPAQTILDLANQAISSAGPEAVGLLSLSAGDYGPLAAVVSSLIDSCQKEHVAVSLPSLRTDTLTPELLERLAKAKKPNFTFAPEAGTERLRSVINKTATEQDLLTAVRTATQAGWRTFKLYFMIGLPTETDTDLAAIASLAKQALAQAHQINRHVQVSVSISTFVPKPHTPFQWEEQIPIQEIFRRQDFLRNAFAKSKIEVRFHSARQSYIEGILARGDQRLAPIIEQAFLAGCRFDAWTDQFDFAKWEKVLKALPVAPEDYLKARDLNSSLAWEHIDAGVDKNFLMQERERAFLPRLVDDCAFTNTCLACGACDRMLPVAKVPAQPLLPIITPSWQYNPHLLQTRTNAAVSSLQFFIYRFHFSKIDIATFLSQLDMVSHILRALKKCGFPLLYSQGFSPKPKVSFSPACPTALASLAEYFDVRAEHVITPEEWIPGLNQVLPPGLRLLAGWTIPVSSPSLSDHIKACSYDVAYEEFIPTFQVEQAIQKFQQQETYPLEIQRKSGIHRLDAKNHLHHISLDQGHLRFDIVSQNTATLRPAEAATIFMGGKIPPWYAMKKIKVTFDHE